MTEARTRMRGQPLVVLGALLLGWTGARVTSLSSGEALSLPEAALTVTAAQAEPVGRTYAGPQSFASFPPGEQAAAYSPTTRDVPIRYVPVWYAAGGRLGYGPGAAALAMRQPREEQPWAANAYQLSGEFPREGLVAPEPQQDGPLPRGLPSLFTGTPTRSTTAQLGEPATLLGGRLGRLIGDRSRWSMDAWALVRKDPIKVQPAGILPATYGSSQAGAVLRYRLAMQSALQPTAYLRATSTLSGSPETAVALGLSARPLSRVPVVAAIEARLTDQSGARRVQPALTAVTTLPPLALPAALRAEIYAQGGYVGGRYATPFADGQVRVDRAVLDVGRAQARVGAGAWGGIQKDASRLDAGPGATVSMPLSPKVFGRLAVDWRFRVAGNAEPDSGPALTVAAGF